MARLRKFIKYFMLVLIGCILSFAILECFLRIYEPFEFRMKGDKIILPVNKKYIIKDNRLKKLDKTIIHTKNSLGFRGQEPPADFGDYLTIITVGGSTTECFFISDGKTWPDILGEKLKHNFKKMFINNAGITGHSTSGHIVLMENHVAKLKPTIVLFLIGRNEIGQGRKRGLQRNMAKMASYSEVFALSQNIYRYLRAKAIGVVWREVNLEESESIEISKEARERIKQEHKDNYLNIYEMKLRKLIRISKENGIIPVIITQPTLFGNEIDDVTNVDLSKIKWKNVNGALAWEVLELYNGVTKKVAANEGVFVIDLAHELEKSSRYFYDFDHYTNAGAQRISEIIYKRLCPFLKENFREYSSGNCE